MSRLKRLVHLLVTCVFILAVTASIAVAKQDNPKKDWPKQITIGVTGGMMGGSYPILAGLGKMIESHLGIPVKITSIAGHDGTFMMRKGMMQIMMPTPASALEALKGIGPVKRLGPSPMRVWLPGLVYGVEYLTFKKSGVKTLGDLKGKTICIGPSAVKVPEDIVRAQLASYGLSMKDCKVVKWDRPTEAYDGLKAGRFDVIQMQGVSPTASTSELFLAYPGRVRLINIDSKHIEDLKKKFIWIVDEKVPAGTYKGMDKAVHIPGVPAFLATSRDIPKSFIYALTKMVWDNFKEFSSFHPLCKRFKRTDIEKLVGVVPFHKGAIQYYREAGIWTKADDEKQAACLATLPKSVR